MNVHSTVAVQVWVDVDEGIAPDVIRLNAMPGVRTLSSCQGTIGEGGAAPYGKYVMVSWEDDDALARIRGEYFVLPEGENWGYALPGDRP